MILLLFLKRLRPFNLMLIALSQYLVFKIFTTFENHTAFAIIFSTSILAGSGNIHNDFCDILSDKINKKQNFFSAHKNKNIFWAFYCISILLALGIGYLYTEVFYTLLFSGALLFLYNLKIQKIALLGNLVIAFLSVISICLPLIQTGTKFTELPTNLYILLCFLLTSCFYLQLFREITKDLIDYKGDYNADFQTLPILIGKERTNKIIILMSSFFVISVIYFLVWFVPQELITYSYVILGLLLPGCYLMYLTMKKKDALLLRISLVTKILIGFGILYMTLYL